MKSGARELSLEGLRDLLAVAKQKAKQVDYEHLIQIKALVKTLTKQAFAAKDAASYARIIMLCKDFLHYCNEQQISQFITSVFEISAEKNAHFRMVVQSRNDDYLTWLLVKNNFLETFSLDANSDGHEITEFEQAILQALNKNPRQCLPEKQILADLQLLKNSNLDDYDHMKSLYYDVKNLLKSACENNDVALFTEVVKNIALFANSALALGRFDILTTVFEISPEDITQLQHAYEAKAHKLLHWYLIDNIQIERYAQHMPWQAQSVQTFKKSVYDKLGLGKSIFSTPELLATRLIKVGGNEAAQAMVMNEAEALAKESFLNRDAKNYAKMLRLAHQLCKELHARKNYPLLAQMLDLDGEELAHAKLLLDTNQDNLFLHFLIENDDLDGLALDYATTLDKKDAKDAVAFKRAVMQALSPTFMLTARDLEHTINSLTQKKMLTSDQLQILSLQFTYALKTALQQNNIEEFHQLIEQSAQLCFKVFQQGKYLEYGSILDMPQAKQDVLIKYLQNNDKLKVLKLLADHEIDSHMGKINFDYTHCDNFKKQLHERMHTTDMSTVDWLEDEFYVDYDNPLNKRHENVQETWRSQIAPIIAQKDFVKMISIRNQAKQRLFEAFEKGDAKDYAKTMRVAIEFKNAAFNSHAYDMAAIMMEISMDDLDFVREAILGQPKASQLYTDWLMVQYHDLIAYAEWKGLDVSSIHDFIQQVNQELAINPDAANRPAQEIVASLKVALTKDAKQSNADQVHYYAQELHWCLSNALQTQNVQQAKTALLGIVEMIKHAHALNLSFRIGSILELDGDELNDIETILTHQKWDLLTWYGLNSVEVNDALRITRQSAAEKRQLKSDILSQMKRPKTTLIAPIPILLQRGMQALTGMDETAIKLWMLELEAYTRDCFFNNNPEGYAQLIKQMLPLMKQAIQAGRSDLVIQFLDLSNDDAEILHLITAANEDNLTLYKLLQNEAFEWLATKYHMKDEETQQFKKQVHEALTGPGHTLLSTRKNLAEEASSAIQQGQMDEASSLILNAKLNACLEFHYEQQDANEYAQDIAFLTDYIFKTYQQGHMDLILDKLDLSKEERDAAMLHLSHLDKAGLMRVLVEYNLREQDLNFAQKGGVRFNSTFRLNVYEALNVLPPEVYSSTKDYVILGVEPRNTISAEKTYIDWFEEKGEQIDLNSEYIQKNIAYLAKLDAAIGVMGYLRAMNTPKAQEIHDVLKELHFKNNLGHRFALSGDSAVANIDIPLEGSTSESMIRSAQDAYSEFTRTHSEAIHDRLMSKLPGATSEQVMKLITKTNQDIQQISLRLSEPWVKQQIQTGHVLNFPITLQAKDRQRKTEYHAVGLTFMGDFCLASDRSREGDEEQGIIVFEVGNKEAVPRIATQYCDSLLTKNRQSLPAHSAFLSDLKVALQLKQVFVDEQEMQIAGNCSWSSCSLMLIRASMLVNLHNYLKQNGINDSEAWTTASKITEDWFAQFVYFDQKEWIQDYLQFHQQPGIKVDADKHILALIELKCTRSSHPEMKAMGKLIEDTHLVSEADRQSAFEHFVNHVKRQFMTPQFETLLDNLNLKIEFDTFAKTVVNLYLEDKISEVEKIYGEFFDKINKLEAKKQKQEEPPVARVSLTASRDAARTQEAQLKTENATRRFDVGRQKMNKPPK